MNKPDFVFEVSYEACNKVGGIYTVLKTKAPYMIEEYGENYLTIGFYDERKAEIEFESKEAPDEIIKVFNELEPLGIKCFYGTWMIPGKPRIILVDSRNFMGESNNIKKLLWEWGEVDSLHADNTFIEPIVWSYSCGKLIEGIVKSKSFKGKKCVCQFHEWLSGTGLLYLKNSGVKIATVFTTHASMLGRTLAGNGVDIYSMTKGKRDENTLNELARKYGVIDKHTMEAACARQADILTTVSSVTAEEVNFFWGRNPEIITLNGIDSEKSISFEELTVRRRRNRVQTRDFLTSYFMRYYPLDLMNIRSIFISGRYEFRNKGLDVFIAALGKLNSMLKENKVEKNVVTFIFVPAGIRGENIDVLKNKSLYEEIKDHVQESLTDIGDSILNKIILGERVDRVVSDDFRQKCKKLSSHFLKKRGERPPLCAFELTVPEDRDAILSTLKFHGLLNREEDKVKVIYYPAYLSSADRLMSLDYADATLTFDVGVFPSYYEPWGYTPVETAAQGSLSITSDQAGFGKFINGKGNGIYVLKRMGTPLEDTVTDLSEKLFEIVTLPIRELAHRRMNAKDLSMMCDWKELIKNYLIAHELAVEKIME